MKQTKTITLLALVVFFATVFGTNAFVNSMMRQQQPQEGGRPREVASLTRGRDFTKMSRTIRFLAKEDNDNSSNSSNKDTNSSTGGGGGGGGGDDIPREELIGSSSYSSKVDWDAEWKKVMADQQTGKPVERPGEGYYKSEAEIKAIQAANKAAQQAAKVQASLPSWQMLKGDWKFWIGILAILSIGTSLLSAASMNAPPPESGGGSYYI